MSKLLHDTFLFLAAAFLGFAAIYILLEMLLPAAAAIWSGAYQ